MSNENWDFSREREFIEKLLNQRFNFFILFYTIVISGLLQCRNIVQFRVISLLGFTISFLLSLTIFRSQQKLDIIIEEHIKKIKEHPLTIVDKEAGCFSARRLIGYVIPLICVAFLLLCSVISCLWGIWYLEN